LLGECQEGWLGCKEISRNFDPSSLLHFHFESLSTRFYYIALRRSFLAVTSGFYSVFGKLVVSQSVLLACSLTIFKSYSCNTPWRSIGL
jgi:hypothetical protein